MAQIAAMIQVGRVLRGLSACTEEHCNFTMRAEKWLFKRIIQGRTTLSGPTQPLIIRVLFVYECVFACRIPVAVAVRLGVILLAA